MTDLRAPDAVLFDEQVPIRATGFDPGRRVTLRARRETDSEDGGVRATFEADEAGTVDPARMPPVEGDYEGIRPMGLFQFRQSAGRDRDWPVVTTVTAAVEGTPVASTTVERRAAGDGVTATAVDVPDLVGDLYLPPGDGPHPGVIYLGGSEGGRPSSLIPRLLASRGYAVLGLAYFGAEGLPEDLIEVPLSYFERAAEWFGDRDAVVSAPMGVIGVSRGSEPALALATRRPDVRLFVGYAASPVHFQGLADGGDATGALADDGESLPYVPFWWGPEMNEAMAAAHRDGDPISFAPTYRRGIAEADGELVDAATLPVEAVEGPVLLVSGADDRMWNAAELGERAIERLDERGYDYPYHHLVYEDAGHAIRPPYLGVEGRERSDPDGGLPVVFGGTPEGYARADADAWGSLLEWLRAGLDAPRTVADPPGSGLP